MRRHATVLAALAAASGCNGRSGGDTSASGSPGDASTDDETTTPGGVPSDEVGWVELYNRDDRLREFDLRVVAQPEGERVFERRVSIPTGGRRLLSDVFVESGSYEVLVVFSDGQVHAAPVEATVDPTVLGGTAVTSSGANAGRWQGVTVVVYSPSDVDISAAYG